LAVDIYTYIYIYTMGQKSNTDYYGNNFVLQGYVFTRAAEIND